MMNAIIIPIYKSDLDSQELISLKRCFSILGKHTIIFVAPEGLDVSYYEKEIEQKINVERFDKSYFADIAGYNTLMLSKIFYERFLNFEYILIYQLDCYVFRDELDYWCQQGYDYIGAPWIFEEYYKLPRLKRKIIYWNNKYNFYHNISKLSRKNIYLKVGNGGFSLRNVQKFYNEVDHKYVNQFKSNDNASVYNEDVFWSVVTKKIKKPPLEKGIKFALDPCANRGFVLNNNELPFGCHAWNRNINFWKKYITEIQ